MAYGEPDFRMEGVEEEFSFYLKDGEKLIEQLSSMLDSGKFETFEFETSDERGNDYVFECWGFKSEDRYGINRLYLFVHDTEDENENRGCLYFLAQNNDGGYLIMLERDQVMFTKMTEFFTGSDDESAVKVERTEVNSEKKKGNGWAIALKIIAFPFWLLWEFIKALLSLFNIAVGDSSAVQSFKRGYNGDSAPMDEYTFINDMGCEQTVYSSNGRDFYDSNGTYVGSSNDHGKTIHK